MQKLELRGTYFEIGKAFGKCKRGLDKYKAPTEEKLEFAFKCEDALKEYAWDLHDELRGFQRELVRIMNLSS